MTSTMCAVVDNIHEAGDARLIEAAGKAQQAVREASVCVTTLSSQQ